MTSLELTNKIKTWITIYQLLSFVVLLIVVKNLYQSNTEKEVNNVELHASVTDNINADDKR